MQMPCCRYNSAIWLRPQPPLSFSHFPVIILLHNHGIKESNEVWCSHKTKEQEMLLLFVMGWERAQCVGWKSDGKGCPIHVLHIHTEKQASIQRLELRFSICFTHWWKKIMLDLTFLNHQFYYQYTARNNIDEAFSSRVKCAEVINDNWIKLVILQVELLL